jgi:hypothetical protein
MSASLGRSRRSCRSSSSNAIGLAPLAFLSSTPKAVACVAELTRLFHDLTAPDDDGEESAVP